MVGLVDRLTDLALASLRSQLDAGASAVQVFDSWAGILSPRHYEELVLPATRRSSPSWPSPTRASRPSCSGWAPASCWAYGLGRQHRGRHRLAGAARRGPPPGGPGLAVQGNLDPALCLGRVGRGRGGDPRRPGPGRPEPGHIFNLGHGVLPETDPAILEQVVALVHAEGRAGWRP